MITARDHFHIYYLNQSSKLPCRQVAPSGFHIRKEDTGLMFKVSLSLHSSISDFLALPSRPGNFPVCPFISKLHSL